MLFRGALLSFFFVENVLHFFFYYFPYNRFAKGSDNKKERLKKESKK